MQVFVPLPDFQASLACLDYRRLGKQRVECQQILNVLSAKRALPVAGGEEWQVKRGWSNHPATLSWEGHESALAVYLTMCINEWIARGYVNNMMPPYLPTFQRSPGWSDLHVLEPDGRDAVLPPWWGRPDVHSSHRSNLLRKDASHYGKFGWTDDPSARYIWPLPTGDTYS